MEKQAIYDMAFELKNQLIQTPQYLNLKECEKQLSLDINCKELIDNYHSAMKEYSENSSSENLKKVHLIKLEMDTNPIVMEYKKAYKEYQILLGEITEVVFNGFAKESIIDKIIRAK